MTYPIKSPRKLIEVALPLDAINAASVRESYIYKGNPSSLHKWWAQRPLAAARAVIFAQLVNDPGHQRGGGFQHGKAKPEAAVERHRLFKLIEELVSWESTNNPDVLQRARAEIQRSWREVCALNRNHPSAATLFDPEKLPALADPFAGGGTIPLEAQRLGFEAHASDLNPVAVLINKALIEIPPRFEGIWPVGQPIADQKRGRKLPLSEQWPGSTGLAEDIRRYGGWMSNEAHARLGHLYPPVKITAKMATGRLDLKELTGKQVTAIAWLWARTVNSPSPAYAHVQVPLASTYILSSKSGTECFVQPETKRDQYRFVTRVGKPPTAAGEGSKAEGAGADFRCIFSDAPISGDYIKAEAQAGRMGTRLMAVAVDTPQGRLYLPPTDAMEEVAHGAMPTWKPDVDFFQQALGFRVGNYGMTKWSDIFTARQLMSFTTLSDLVIEARQHIRQDAAAAGMQDDDVALAAGGDGARAYAEAVSVYLAFVLSKMADYNSTLVPWYTEENRPGHLFSKQTIPMVWDFAELNLLSDIGGGLAASIKIVADALGACPIAVAPGKAVQRNAEALPPSPAVVISTDPPYYDNIGYADLSDFFYVWLRRSIKSVYPDLFATVAVPKAEELVATPGRHGTKDEAERFFLDGMTRAMASIASATHPALPVTIYYAFKQSTTKADGTVSVGWDTFLEAVNRAGFALTGTWPMRTERSARSRGQGSNALASSIVLVCRRRASDAPVISRRDFLRELNTVLPDALDEMTKGAGGDRSPVAPVDLSQAIIGPGMAVFSRYAAVLEADGSPMSVRTALQLINRFLAEDDFDSDTQFCLHWFEQSGWRAGKFGDADTLARAKGTSVDGVKAAGVVESGGGFVRLFKWSEYTTGWNPKTDTRNPIWETLHHLIRALKQDGEAGAGRLLAAVKEKGEAARQLSYRLYTLCERQGWAEDARAYNELITSWNAIEAAAGTPSTGPAQRKLFD